MAVDELVQGGNEVATVELNIDYRIIEHFSENLYSSPNKAVEELVANGFDAFAQRVYVYTPGAYMTDRVVVWDDGWSMDVEGLKNLWVIASSPKKQNRIQRGPRGDERKIIGKFGIGKLASYTVGNEILHLCRKDGRFLLVSVDYRDIHGEEGSSGATMKEPLKRPILEISEDDARRFVSEVFADADEADALDVFEEESWTLAVVEDLKIDNLPPGRLSWVLGNGMPLRPDFRVWVNDDSVEPKLAESDLYEWRFDEPKVLDSLQRNWKSAREDGFVEGELNFTTKPGLDPFEPEADVPVVEFPNLEDVWGHIRLFRRPLTKGRQTEQGRSHGFFVLVRGRLLNPRDPKFLLHDPQFGTFNRSQFVIHSDALDEDLLAPRTGIHEDTEKTRELAVLQAAMYTAARAELDNLDVEEGEASLQYSLLPTRSRDHFRRPLMALMARRDMELADDFRLSDPQIERRALAPDGPLATLEDDGSGFAVNADHPYFKTVHERLGKRTKAAKKFEQWFNLFAVSELLFEGHLFEIGLAEQDVDEVIDWRDRMYRHLARSYEENPHELLVELKNASFSGDTQFEDAIAGVLGAMGFEAERRGGSGEEDVFLLASLGPQASFELIFEAKGSKHAVGVSDADVGAAARHRDKEGVEADHAVIVAREFAGFSLNPHNRDAAIMEECESVGGVSILTVEALEKLFLTVNQYAYPLDLLWDVFTVLESPGEKLARIDELEDPTESFDFRQLLDDIWDRQFNQAKGDWVSYRTIMQNRPEWRDNFDIDDFEMRLVALEQLSSSRIQLDRRRELVYLLQAPEKVVYVIQRQLAEADEASEPGEDG